MKKITLIIAAFLSFYMSACSQSNQKQEDKQMKKTLFAFFSASGVTKGVAEQLATTAGADLFEIKPEKPYTEADLDWRNKQSRSSVEMADKSSRPAIAKKLDNIGDYEVIYVGFPIWWYTAPTIINTFIESHPLKGKTLIPFATSGGSSIKKACEDLEAAYPDINWKQGKLLNSPSKKDIEDFIK